MLSYVAMHSKQHKTTKVIKLQWLASIWCQNDQNDRNNAKLQMRSNYNEFASIWRQYDQKCWVTLQNIQNNAKVQKRSNYDELHRFRLISIKTTQNYKSNQITMTCIDLMSKRSKRSKQRKLQKRSNYNELHRFDVITIKNVELRRKTFKTT